jgi:site-specific recombinase XerD
VTATAQQRAVVEALGLSPADLRELAQALERHTPVTLVRHLADTAIAALPPGHLYVTSLRRLVRWAGDEDASTIDADDIARWARQAGDEARASSQARHGVGAEEAFVLAARAAYTRAVATGAVGHNPAAEVDLPARPATLRTALECGQLKQAHLCLVAHSRDPELDDVVFQLLRETACRRGGAIALSAGDLAPATRTARLTEKYGRQRWVPISAHLMERLVAHQAARHPGCDRVLHRKGGGHLNDKWFEGFGHRIQQLAWAAELGVTAHWLRHTTLTDVERLAGVRVAGAYAGHSDTSFGVTGRYTKASPQELRWAHERLFFDQPADAANPAVAPQLFRRVLPTATHPVEFVAA